MYGMIGKAPVTSPELSQCLCDVLSHLELLFRWRRNKMWF